MKKLLLFAAVTVIGFSAAQSQEIRLGAKAGVNFASIGGDETSELDGRTSFHIGGLVEIPISEKFAIQPELLYSSLGAKVEGSETYMGETFSFEEKAKLDYITVPVMAKYYVMDGLSLEAGPQIGILVSAKNEYTYKGGGEDESGEDDMKDSTNSLDFGLGLGAAYRLNNGVFFSARYVLGLSNILDYKDNEFDYGDLGSFKRHNNVIQLSAGFSF